MIAVELFQQVYHSFNSKRTTFVVWSVVFNLLLLKVALLDIEVQKLHNILYEQHRIDFVDLTRLSERSILANVDQREILGHPRHEIDVLFLDLFVFRGVCRQA